MFRNLNAKSVVSIILLNLFREQKTDIFKKHLKSLPFSSITIEYKSMIDYVDRELLDQNND